MSADPKHDPMLAAFKDGLQGAFQEGYLLALQHVESTVRRFDPQAQAAVDRAVGICRETSAAVTARIALGRAAEGSR